MQMDVTPMERATIVRVSGSMDAVAAPLFQEQFHELIDGQRFFVVDVSGLDYISSAGLRAIIEAAKRVKADQGAIVFCGLQGMVKEVFEISYFTNMFPVYVDVDEALASL
jgi:anti-anti-sigma factor